MVYRWRETSRREGNEREGAGCRRQARGVGIVHDYVTALYVDGCLTYHDTIQRRDATRYPGSSDTDKMILHTKMSHAAKTGERRGWGKAKDS